MKSKLLGIVVILALWGAPITWARSVDLDYTHTMVASVDSVVGYDLCDTVYSDWLYLPEWQHLCFWLTLNETETGCGLAVGDTLADTNVVKIQTSPDQSSVKTYDPLLKVLTDSTMWSAKWLSGDTTISAWYWRAMLIHSHTVVWGDSISDGDTYTVDASLEFLVRGAD